MEKSIDIRKNSFDLFRIAAASQVALVHFLYNYLLISGGSNNQILVGFKFVLDIFPGVLILFSISGF